MPHCGFESTWLKRHGYELAVVDLKTTWYVPFILIYCSPRGSTLQCPTDSVWNPVILPEWHRNPPEWDRNGTGIHHKGLTGSPKLASLAIFNVKGIFINIYIVLHTF